MDMIICNGYRYRPEDAPKSVLTPVPAEPAEPAPTEPDASGSAETPAEQPEAAETPEQAAADATPAKGKTAKK